jgi:hypothetical protein
MSDKRTSSPQRPASIKTECAALVIAAVDDEPLGPPDDRISPRVIFCSRCIFDPLRDEPVLARNVLLRRRWSMDQSEDPRELERKIETASRIASTLTDQSTIERLRAWVGELRQSLRQCSAARRTDEEIKARASRTLGAKRLSHRPRLGVLASSRV